mmetsp:Transcript_29026/g.93239  ORF Transcript_29026/g.93239 Transcript_29026/m.93239 type:complete len:251 (+) Transcript_29026:146-898(+)
MHSSEIMWGMASETLEGKKAIGRDSVHSKTPSLPAELGTSVTRPERPLNITDFRPTSTTGCPTRNWGPPTITSTGLSGQGATAPPTSGGVSAALGEEADIDEEVVGGGVREAFSSESTSASSSPRRLRILTKQSTKPACAVSTRAAVWPIRMTELAAISSLTCATEIRLTGTTGSRTGSAAAGSNRNRNFSKSSDCKDKNFSINFRSPQAPDKGETVSKAPTGICSVWQAASHPERGDKVGQPPPGSDSV